MSLVYIFLESKRYKLISIPLELFHQAPSLRVLSIEDPVNAVVTFSPCTLTLQVNSLLLGALKGLSLSSRLGRTESTYINININKISNKY